MVVPFLRALALTVVPMLFFAAPASADRSCYPIGQFAYISDLTKNSVAFLQVSGEPNISKAEINSFSCKGIEPKLSDQSYRKLQEISASAQRAFVLLRPSMSVTRAMCLIGVKTREEILAQPWAPSGTKCAAFKSELLQLKSAEGHATVYVNSEQLKLLSARQGEE